MGDRAAGNGSGSRIVDARETFITLTEMSRLLNKWPGHGDLSHLREAVREGGQPRGPGHHHQGAEEGEQCYPAEQ
jgi:hypothetical protein